MFNHIHVKHPGYFQEMTQKKWLLEAQSGKPLKICWNKMNDFDEEETVVLYGCMATKKTFMTEHKAMAHFTKCPEAFKDHNKEIKLLIKIRKDALKANQKEKRKGSICTDPRWLKYKELRKSNDPILLKEFTDYIECQLKDAIILYNDTQNLKTAELSLLGKSVSEIHIDFERIRQRWPTLDKSHHKKLSIVRNSLNEIICGLEHIDGGANVESEARMFVSDWSEFF